MQEQTFLQKIQAADEKKKRVWLVASSAVIMLFVVYVWLGYFNVLTAAPNDAPQADQAQGVAVSGFSLGTTVHGSMAFLYEIVLDRIHNIESLFTTPRDYTITPQTL